ncbi:unnamed protein product [Candidula unifasciata]|uniref:Large ribosomal subunit protein mL38 n=1 Tax=Candidula unifasciata TaxID=100452 RepID=A0A8S3YHK4_9EUPU|nr:unnamed protein product [Candidula unifasciata]
MALSATSRSCIRLTARSVNIQPVRFRWKPPKIEDNVFPSHAERLAEWNARYVAPASQGINIGFYNNHSESRSQKLDMLKKWTVKRKQLEQAARHKTLKIDLDLMKKDWMAESMPLHVKKMATHYGLFSDLFDGAHFHPIVPLSVSFDYDEEFITPVYYGNVIPAAETAVKPFVSYESAEDNLWTLVMTSPDGNLEDHNKELLHWLVGNIPGANIERGVTVCDYLQPFPPKGVGYLRYAFVLYKQERELDFNQWQRPAGCLSLRERTFSNFEFYRQNEDSLTPAGLSFFQSEWDKTVTSVFHHVLDMKEPAFEFIHPPFYHPEQLEFPHREPFNVYLDKYRDVKDIQEEVLREKLKHVDISKPASRQQYPCIDLLPKETPSWLKSKIQLMRQGREQWRDLFEKP